MKISYYTSISSKDDAEAKLMKVSCAVRDSKLPFICDIEYKYGSYHITVELKVDAFTDWDSMEKYIRKLVIAQNVSQHIQQDIETLERELCSK